MKGLGIDGRFIAFIGAHPEIKINEYGNKEVSFSNRRCNYYYGNVYKKIYTFKDLIFWRRLLGHDIKYIKKQGKTYVRVIT